MVSPECTGTTVALPSVCEGRCGCPLFVEDADLFLTPEAEGESYGDLLNANELQRPAAWAFGIQTKLNGCTYTLHQCV